MWEQKEKDYLQELEDLRRQDEEKTLELEKLQMELANADNSEEV